MSFTQNQLRAIHESGNIIVSAGAGSGKTTVMIARIIDKLTRCGASLDDMLIVTFTRASAADMRAKLTEKLYELRGGEFSDIAEAALECIPTSNIGTLHSFCQKLLRQYFYAAGLDPSAVVCEEGEAASLMRQAVQGAVDAAWKSADPCFLTMYDMLCSRRSDDGVKNAVERILGFAISMPDPIEYLTCDRQDGEYFDALDGIVKSRREDIIERISALKADLAAAKMSKHIIGADDMIAYLDGITDEITSTSHRARYDYTDELNKQYLGLKKECKAFRDFAAEAAETKKVNSAPYSIALRTVALDAYNRYAERKKALGKMDYSDLEHGAYRVLTDSDCISEISGTIKYVFIDEFQDVNPLQSAIAECLKQAGAEMFVVGDVKQSIYGFRRCSPEHFKRAVASPDYTHIALTDNFRSSGEVIDFVNTVFDGVMTDDFGGVDYSDDAQRLKWGNKQISGGSAAFYTVDETEHDSSDDGIAAKGYSVVNAAKAEAPRECEAEFVADCIVDYIKHSDKPKAGGIAVLVRSVRTPFCAALELELKQRGIKYNIGKDRAASSYPEVAALMDILRCADNRLDDVALYTAMRSALGGFSDGELAEIAFSGERACRNANVKPIDEAQSGYALWQKVSAYDGKLRAKVDRFIAERQKIVDFSLNHDCADVLGFVTSSIDYFQHVYECGGSAAAVDALIRHAADRAMDMHAFLSYYDGGGVELASDSDGDSVTITTIHSSKGLEYDFVIVADTAKKFNESDRYSSVIASENGVFVKLPDEGTRMLVKSAPWMVESLLYPDRMRGEELRLLYVALTRAKHKLVVCGKNKQLKPVAPKDGKCIMAYLQNVPKSAPDIERLPIGEPPCDYEFDGAVAEAVEKRHRTAKSYNEARSLLSLPVKTCVTAVAHGEWEGDYTAASPVLTVDDRDGEGDAMLRGTAYHRAMEMMDFANPDLAYLREKSENFDLVDEKQILAAAGVMKELTRGSAFVAKERYFIVNLPASEVYGGEAPGSVLVQGVIDLLIVDKDGNATIIDYKTGSPSSLHNSGYRKQLQLYSAAVERATPYRVKHALLYSFAAGKTVEP